MYHFKAVGRDVETAAEARARRTRAVRRHGNTFALVLQKEAGEDKCQGDASAVGVVHHHCSARRFRKERSRAATLHHPLCTAAWLAHSVFYFVPVSVVSYLAYRALDSFERLAFRVGPLVWANHRPAVEKEAACKGVDQVHRALLPIRRGVDAWGGLVVKRVDALAPPHSVRRPGPLDTHRRKVLANRLEAANCGVASAA